MTVPTKNDFPILLILLLTSILFFACSEDNIDENEALFGNDIDKESLLNHVNELRINGCECGGEFQPPVPALTWNTLLEKAAYKHSLEMSANNNMTHTGQNGSGPGDRVGDEGYNYERIGENIHHGSVFTSQVINSWANSPGHCKNMMKDYYTEMGVGRKNLYWTLNLALPE